MNTFLFVLLVIISIILLANVVAAIRAVTKLQANEAFDWFMSLLLTAVWVIIFFLVRN